MPSWTWRSPLSFKSSQAPQGGERRAFNFVNMDQRTRVPRDADPMPMSLARPVRKYVRGGDFSSTAARAACLLRHLGEGTAGWLRRRGGPPDLCLPQAGPGVAPRSRCDALAHRKDIGDDR